MPPFGLGMPRCGVKLWLHKLLGRWDGGVVCHQPGAVNRQTKAGESFPGILGED